MVCVILEVSARVYIVNGRIFIFCKTKKKKKRHVHQARELIYMKKKKSLNSLVNVSSEEGMWECERRK